MRINLGIVHECITKVTSFGYFTRELENSLGLLRPASFDMLGANPASVANSLLDSGDTEKLVLYNIIEHKDAAVSKQSPFKWKKYHIGSPAIAELLTREDVGTALYFPLCLLVYEDRHTQVTIEYQLPSSLLSRFNNQHINTIAARLDQKLAKLIDDAAVLISSTNK